jgi:hypothetical protein
VSELQLTSTADADWFSANLVHEDPTDDRVLDVLTDQWVTEIVDEPEEIL